MTATLPGLRAFLLDPGGPVGRDMLRRTLAVHARAVSSSPVDHGRMRSAHRFSLLPEAGRLVGRVVVETDYAEHVHNGTAPHTITARRASVLRFTSGGQIVFARSVNHPGTKARPWLRDSLPAASG